MICVITYSHPSMSYHSTSEVVIFEWFHPVGWLVRMEYFFCTTEFLSCAKKDAIRRCNIEIFFDANPAGKGTMPLSLVRTIMYPFYLNHWLETRGLTSLCSVKTNICWCKLYIDTSYFLSMCCRVLCSWLTKVIFHFSRVVFGIWKVAAL